MRGSTSKYADQPVPLESIAKFLLLLGADIEPQGPAGLGTNARGQIIRAGLPTSVQRCPQHTSDKMRQHAGKGVLSLSCPLICAVSVQTAIRLPFDHLLIPKSHINPFTYPSIHPSSPYPSSCPPDREARITWERGHF